MEILESPRSDGGSEVQDDMRRVPKSVRGAKTRGSRRRIQTLPIPQFCE